MILHFKCDDACLIKIGNETFWLKNVLHLEIDKITTFFVGIFFETTTTVIPPILCEIFLEQNVLKSKCEFLKIIKIANKEYEIRIHTPTNQYGLLLQEKNYVVKNGVEIYLNQQLIFHELFNAINATCENVSNNTILFCINSFKVKKIIIIKESKILLCKNATSYELSSSKITFFTDLNDMLNQGLIEEYEISENEITPLNSYSVYISGKPRTVKNKKYNPLLFFQCVKSKNFKYIKTLLSDNLKNKISMEHLQAYLKNFDEIDILSIEDEKALFRLYHLSDNASAKNFSVIINNNLIEDIV